MEAMLSFFITCPKALLSLQPEPRTATGTAT